MFPPEHFKRIRKAAEKYQDGAKSADIMKLCRNYRRACIKFLAVRQAGEKVRGLDEFDPKHMSWEKRVYEADMAMDFAKEVLLHSARCTK